MDYYILNITNGDCAVSVMQKAGIAGIFLPWRDVLHDGPVPAGLSLDELSEIRGEFISNRGWGETQKIHQSFLQRDAILKTAADFDKVVLWFEHDLYDQLQLVQVLDWFADHPLPPKNLSMICVDQYLGPLEPEALLTLRQFEMEVTTEQLKLAQKAWSAFRSPTPVSLQKTLETDTSALPFLKKALQRLIEEYPACENGLSRTQHSALTIIESGIHNPAGIFAEHQNSEEAMYLGDSSFWFLLDQMINSHPPLLELNQGDRLDSPPASSQTLTITETGKAVLRGEQNWLDIQPPDFWIGGVHLNTDNLMCRNASGIQIVS